MKSSDLDLRSSQQLTRKSETPKTAALPNCTNQVGNEYHSRRPPLGLSQMSFLSTAARGVAVYLLNKGLVQTRRAVGPRHEGVIRNCSFGVLPLDGRAQTLPVWRCKVALVVLLKVCVTVADVSRAGLAFSSIRMRRADGSFLSKQVSEIVAIACPDRHRRVRSTGAALPSGMS